MDSLERQVMRCRNLNSLPGCLGRRIEAKYERHRLSYGVRLDPLAQTLKTNPALIDQMGDLPQLSLFFRSHVVIALAGAPSTSDLWCLERNEWVPVVRFANRLLVSNPHTGEKESWGKLQSESQEGYIVHRRIGGRTNKSRFDGKIPYIETLEREVLAKGKGLLLSETKMRLYARFEDRIGTSPQRDELNFMCLEMTRVPRPPRRRPGTNGKSRRNGWMLSVHGYPLDEHGLVKDFQGTKLTGRMIPTLQNPG